jgi:hypothetical protein
MNDNGGTRRSTMPISQLLRYLAYLVGEQEAEDLTHTLRKA